MTTDTQPQRIAIAGAPRSGKTTLARALDPNAKHTDDLSFYQWSTQSYLASQWFSDPTIYTIEGTTVIRAIRKWLKLNQPGRPCDTLVYLHIPLTPLNMGQLRMAKATLTILNEIRDELIARGTTITEHHTPITDLLRAAVCGTGDVTYPTYYYDGNVTLTDNL